MPVDLDECPCSGKNMSTLLAPWILLTLYRHEGTHGYEIQKMIQQRLCELGLGSNIAGLYRHLKMLEKRGLVKPIWDTGETGPARRTFFLTEAGKECLARWMKTLSIQMSLIGKLLDEANRTFLPLTSSADIAHKDDL
ncbi:helix-turn-helix transcriptional regulator [Desulforhabdus amnigena]|jgi:DNA-binding PadR family transcriptional regulator|uniref:PadR family transcriptional regulator n=1 Tax=Desulforhabdus amnigena TaxID=40218 RepID=A0A9W6D4L4_9BACT|nr:helix-turn-helix transcriptional regulator [Desulforhabdus amnigena]NLJ29657.1 PadR family transcriptional regulator [Deltaproteobacteria bacterium]GLI33071.1 PadR family transcriptional regulator [Desulforhabdus amnigena]